MFGGKAVSEIIEPIVRVSTFKLDEAPIQLHFAEDHPRTDYFLIDLTLWEALDLAERLESAVKALQQGF
jgi:hypothetical protein